MEKVHNLVDAIINGEIKISGIKVAIAVMDTRFMMARMGYIVGKQITWVFETVTKKSSNVLLLFRWNKNVGKV